MAGRFELVQSARGPFYFVLKAGNGEVILTSEMYTSKQAALSGIASVRANAMVDGRFIRKTSSGGSHYFNLSAANGEVIGASEMYASPAGRDHGIESVKVNSQSNDLVER